VEYVGDVIPTVLSQEVVEGNLVISLSNDGTITLTGIEAEIDGDTIRFEDVTPDAPDETDG
jgi:hypothetical protein